MVSFNTWPGCIKKDFPRAVELYNVFAILEDNVDDMYRLAVILKSGVEGVEVDTNRSLQLLIQAVEEEIHIPSMNMINSFRNDSEGVVLCNGLNIFSP